MSDDRRDTVEGEIESEKCGAGEARKTEELYERLMDVAIVAAKQMREQCDTIVCKYVGRTQRTGEEFAVMILDEIRALPAVKSSYE